MRNFLFFMLLLVSVAFSQDVIKANKQYTPKEDMVVLTEQQFNKLDSLLGDTLRYQKKVELLQFDVSKTDSINKKLESQLINLQEQIKGYVAKDSLSVLRMGLYEEKSNVYKGLFVDMQKQLDKSKGKTGFFNNTFWFGTGVVVGGATLFVGSLIVHNVK